MEIQEMTLMSHSLLVMAGILAVLAVILFFWLDIPKCVRMVFAVRSRDRKKSDKQIEYRPQNISGKHESVITEKLENTDTLAGYDEETVLLDHCTETQAMYGEETLPLYREDELEDLNLCVDSAQTELMETNELEMIQDIVLIQDQQS